MAEPVKRTELMRRLSSLEAERSSWLPHWREIADYLIPRSGRFNLSNSNRGGKKHNNIYNSTGTFSLDVMAAGMMSGMTSPARPWFRLALPDRQLMEFWSVKRWLADTTSLMLTVYAKSNTYLMLHEIYRQLGAFGTAASIMMDDFETIIHHHDCPVGEFSLATDYRGRVNTLFRKFDMTVDQIVREFGYSNCSLTVRGLYDSRALDKWVTVCHAIEPRTVRDTKRSDAKSKAFRSCYFEVGGDSSDTVLREGGYDRFPALAPRWHRQAGDVYGDSPAMTALGDIKQLQHQELRKATGIDYQTKPPIQAPASMRSREIDLLPGGVTYVEGAQNGKVENLFSAPINLNHLMLDIERTERRIERAFFADMFKMLSLSDRPPSMTATEVVERHNEKMTVLGPVLERLHNELLAPLIEETFIKMIAAGIVPAPPQELQGVELDVEFVSVLAQAQKAASINGIDRFTANLGAIAQISSGVLDKFDSDRWVDAYADMLGVDPSLIVPSDRVALIRKQKAEAIERQQQMEAVAVQAKAARDLGAVNTGEKNAATDVLRMFSGYTG